MEDVGRASRRQPRESPPRSCDRLVRDDRADLQGDHDRVDVRQSEPAVGDADGLDRAQAVARQRIGEVGRAGVIVGDASQNDRHGVSAPPVRLEPAKPGQSRRSRVIFTADEALVTEAVQLGEQEGVVQLFAIRFVPRRHAGDLDVAGNRSKRAQSHDHVAMHDLAVVDVELQASGWARFRSAIRASA